MRRGDLHLCGVSQQTQLDTAMMTTRHEMTRSPPHAPKLYPGSTPVGREPGLHGQLQALQALFTSFMEVIISQMAG
jgi:hypothetical protein